MLLGDPLAHLSFILDSPIYINDANIQVSALELDVQVYETDAEADLSTTMKLTNVGNDAQTVTFTVSADAAQTSGYSFSGKEIGKMCNVLQNLFYLRKLEQCLWIGLAFSF